MSKRKIDKLASKNKFYNLYYRFVMKIIDIIFGIIGSIIAVFIVILAKLLYICNGDFNKVLFRQERIGKNGKPIYIFKLRTMVPFADDMLEDILKKDKKKAAEYKKYKKLKDDPRITKVGKFLRKASLDEFPQFFNLLGGSMTIVGPRPYLYREQKEMTRYYKSVISVKPGITGYWQVNGRNDTDFDYRLELDNYYLKHRSLLMDIKIIIKTIKQIIFRKGL